jgi:hypothetical protein
MREKSHSRVHMGLSCQRGSWEGETVEEGEEEEINFQEIKGGRKWKGKNGWGGKVFLVTSPVGRKGRK